MNSDSHQIAHVLWGLPELVSKIQSYLPPSDLLSICTRVNSLWEREARRVLLRNPANNPITLNCHNIRRYMEVMAVRNGGQCHSSIRFHLRHDFGDVLGAEGMMLRELKLFISKNSDQVKHLSFYVSHLDVGSHAVLREGVASQLQDFQDLASLNLWNCWEPFFEGTVSNWSTTISSLSLLTASSQYNQNLGSLLAMTLPNLVRLEFSLLTGFVGVEAISRYCSDWERLLTKYAPTLGHLSIRKLKQSYFGTSSKIRTTLTLPLLPKLTTLQIHRTVSNYDSARVGIELKFEGMTGNVLNYSKQFPILASLYVGIEWESTFKRTRPSMTNYDWLSESASFMTATFLGPPYSRRHLPCDTVTHLDIPRPCRDEVCSCAINFRGSCDTWRKTKGSNYALQVSRTFPNAN